MMVFLYNALMPDILRFSQSQTSFVVKNLQIFNKPYLFYDVTGQKETRKRWLTLFDDDIDCVIYMVSLAGFDKTIMDPSEKNIGKNTSKPSSQFLDSVECFRNLMGNNHIRKLRIVILLVDKLFNI